PFQLANPALKQRPHGYFPLNPVQSEPAASRDPQPIIKHVTASPERTTETVVLRSDLFRHPLIPVAQDPAVPLQQSRVPIHAFADLGPRGQQAISPKDPRAATNRASAERQDIRLPPDDGVPKPGLGRADRPDPDVGEAGAFEQGGQLAPVIEP